MALSVSTRWTAIWWAAKNPSSAAEEPRAGAGLLVGEDLGIGQAGVVINGGVDIVIADGAAAGAVPIAGAMLGRVAAIEPVAATVAQPAQLLDIDMDQLARPSSLIAADHLAGGAVQ